MFKVNGIIEEVLKNDINVRLNVSIVTLSFIFIVKIKSVVQIYSITISTFEHTSKCGAKQSAIYHICLLLYCQWLTLLCTTIDIKLFTLFRIQIYISSYIILCKHINMEIIRTASINFTILGREGRIREKQAERLYFKFINMQDFRVL